MSWAGGLGILLAELLVTVIGTQGQWEEEQLLCGTAGQHCMEGSCRPHSAPRPCALRPSAAPPVLLPFHHCSMPTDVSFGLIGVTGVVSAAQERTPQYALLAAPIPGRENSGPRPGGPLIVGCARFALQSVTARYGWASV